MNTTNRALREVNKPLYSYWQALYLSFFDNNLYVDVGKRWKGVGVTYLLLLLAVILIPFSMRCSLILNRYLNEEVIQPFKNMPLIYIQNGQVILDKPMPYFIKNDAGKIVSIIDTTGEVKTIDARYPYVTFLLTKDKFYYRFPSIQSNLLKSEVNSTPLGENNHPVESMQLTPDMNEVFDGERWVQVFKLKYIKYLLLAMVYPAIVVLFFSMIAVFVLVFAFMAQLIAQVVLRFPLTYAQASRLLVVSATPMLTLIIAFLTFNWVFFGAGLVFIAALATYFSFAVISLKRESNKLARS